MNHTPEPWYFDPDVDTFGIGCMAVGPDPEAHPVAHVESWMESGNVEEAYANGLRIANCVNGCKGIVEPEKTVPMLVKAVPMLVKALNDLAISTRSFRNVPVDEQMWTSYDEEALNQAFKLLEEIPWERR